MKLKRSLPNPPLGARVDDLHRPPTRSERFRAWIEDVPTMRLYLVLTAVTWVALTALIGVGSRPPIERNVPEGIIQSGNLSRIEALLLDPNPNPWTVLLGVAMVVGDRARHRLVLPGAIRDPHPQDQHRHPDSPRRLAD